MKKYKIIATLSFVFLLLTIIQRYRVNTFNEISVPYYYEYATERLIGKNLDLIMFNKMWTYKNYYTITLIHEDDCEDCINQCLDIIKSVPDLAYNPILYLSDSSRIKKYDDLDLNIVYSDNVDFYLEKIDYATTPIIIILNNKNIIVDCFYPKVQENNKFSKILEKYKFN